MADKEGNVLAKDYGIGIAPPERRPGKGARIRRLGHAISSGTDFC